MIKKIKCNICNFKFKIEKDKVYIIRKQYSLLSPYVKYDAIDCPNCGCQKILNEREDKYETKNQV